MTNLYAGAAILLMWIAAYTDVKARIIPNWIPVLVLLVFAIYSAIYGGSRDILGHLLWAAGIFCLFFAGFAFGKVGGGDVKLATAAMLWVGPEEIAPFLLIMALTGGVMALAIVLPITRLFWHWACVRVGWGSEVSRFERDVSIPYGVAIAVGATVSIYRGYF